MDLMGMQVAENMRNFKTTVLHRPGGTWDKVEASLLVYGLLAEISSNPKHPEYLILHGHYTKEQTLKALKGGTAYTATQLVGIDNKDLPFRPSFQ